MKETFAELVRYLKNPVLSKDENLSFNYRIKKFAYILLICLITGLFISPVFVLIEELGWVNMEDHAMEDLMKTYSKSIIFLLVAIFAPLLEELIFRAPLTLFKKSSSFKIAFYVFAVIFGFIHLSNFKISTNVLLLAPILVLPQTILGGVFGYVRVRFNLSWSIALHACYNGILMFLSFAENSI